MSEDNAYIITSYALDKDMSVIKVVCAPPSHFAIIVMSNMQITNSEVALDIEDAVQRVMHIQARLYGKIVEVESDVKNALLELSII